MAEVPSEFAAAVIRSLAKVYPYVRMIEMISPERRINKIRHKGEIVLRTAVALAQVTDNTPKALAKAIAEHLNKQGLDDIIRMNSSGYPLDVIVGIERKMELTGNTLSFYTCIAEET
jgi:hypothetical protein